MTDLKLDIAFWNYDRTRALSDGKVRIPGVDARYHSGSNVAEIFRGMVAERRFDVAELGLTYFLRTFKEDESPFVAIPVFPVFSALSDFCECEQRNQQTRGPQRQNHRRTCAV